MVETLEQAKKSLVLNSLFFETVSNNNKKTKLCTLPCKTMLFCCLLLIQKNSFKNIEYKSKHVPSL